MGDHRRPANHGVGGGGIGVAHRHHDTAGPPRRRGAPVGWADILSDMRITELSIESPDAILAGRLPREHEDAFDRVVVSQALRRNLTVATRGATIIDAALAPSVHAGLAYLGHRRPAGRAEATGFMFAFACAVDGVACALQLQCTDPAPSGLPVGCTPVAVELRDGATVQAGSSTKPRDSVTARRVCTWPRTNRTWATTLAPLRSSNRRGMADAPVRRQYGPAWPMRHV